MRRRGRGRGRGRRRRRRADKSVVTIGSRMESVGYNDLHSAKSCMWHGVELKAGDIISVLSSASSATRTGDMTDEDRNPLRQSRARINSIHYISATAATVVRWVLNVCWALDVGDLGQGMDAEMKRVGMTSSDFAMSVGAPMNEYIFVEDSNPQLLSGTNAEFKFTFNTITSTLTLHSQPH